MLNEILNLILSLPSFNPYGLRFIDFNSKLQCKINNKILVSSYTHQEETWSIQLLSRECHSNYEEFNYIDHKTFDYKPNIIQLIITTNKLITKYLQNEH